MAENVGSVFMEVRLRLDSLDHDIMTVSKKFDGLGKKILSGVERPSEILKKTVKALTNEIGGLTQKFTALTGGDAKKYFKDLEKAIKEAEKAGEVEKWAMLEGQRKQAKEIENTIKMLERKKATAESAVVKAQGGEEEARLAVITKLQNDYETELKEINDLNRLGVISAKERDSQIQQAQMKEIKGLEQLKGEYDGLEKEQKTIEDRLKEQAEQYNNLGKATEKNKSSMASFTALTTAGWTKIVDLAFKAVMAFPQFAKESIAVYQAQEVANARLGAVVRATGADAWTSQQKLMDVADELGKQTGYTSKEIQDMQSVLLGFTSITGDTFNRASEGLINMAAVMGGDLAGTANQFGKALDNPAESLETLSRYGLKFTEEQKKQVKQFEETGQHAKAQAIILDSMKAAFGNAATAVNDAVRSQSAYNTEVSRFKTNAGESFEKAVRPIRDFFTSIISGINKATDEQKRYTDNLERIKRLEDLKKIIKSYNDEMARAKKEGREFDFTEAYERDNAEFEELMKNEARTRFEIIEKELRDAQQDLAYAQEQLLLNSSGGLELLGEFSRDKNKIEKQTGVAKEIIARQIEELAQKRQEAIDHYFATTDWRRGILEGSDRSGFALNYDILTQKIPELTQEYNKLTEKVAEETAENEKNAKIKSEMVNIENAINKIRDETKERIEALEKAERDYDDAIAETSRQVNTGLITEKDAEEQRASAASKRVKDVAALNDQYRTYTAIQDQIAIVEKLRDDAGGDYNDTLATTLEELDELQKNYNGFLGDLSNGLTKATDLNKEFNRVTADRSLAEQTKEYTEQIQDLTVSEYEAYKIERERALLALQAASDYQRASENKQKELEDELNLYYASKRRVEISKELESMENDYKNAAIDITREMENRQRIGESEIEWKKRVIENEEQWAIAEVTHTEAYKAAILEAAAGNDEYLRMTERVIAAIKERAEAARAAVEKTGNISFGQEMLEWAKDNIIEIANAGAQVFNSLVEISTTLIQREIKEQNKLLEEQHEAKMKMLDDEMQARLYALGLVEAETVTDYNAQLEAAKLTGDELAIYEASQALTKAQIEQEYADEKARIDEELARKQAELQYKSEVANWKAQMLQAVIGAAQAQISIWAAAIPEFWSGLAGKIAMSALTAATTAASIGVIAANKPVPRFETGGIVPGSSYSGDHMMIRANSGEAVLTQDQHLKLLDMLDSPGQASSVNATVIIQLDAREIGRRTFQLAGDGHYFLKARAVH
ncbi:MAG: phage tail length tape measure family protein [Treponema sp.]|jgi:hypothetical protein|nr:phage tail length tape measure family protein [Treponema sp.]